MAIPAAAERNVNKIVTDPLVVATFETVLSFNFWNACAHLILSSASAYSLPARAILGAVHLAGLGIYVNNHKKEMFYEASLIYSMARTFFFPTAYPWWNKIDDRLYLGAIPLHDTNHLNKILREIRGPLAILSLLEDFELEDKYVFTTAVGHDEWQHNGVKTLQIPAVDCAAVEQDMIQRGIQFIREMQAEGRTVYVHCKAGVGRSATVVAGKLLQDGLADGTQFPSADAAIQHIRSIRNHVTIYKGYARAAIVQFFQRLHAKT